MHVAINFDDTRYALSHYDNSVRVYDALTLESLQVVQGLKRGMNTYKYKNINTYIHTYASGAGIKARYEYIQI